MKNLILRRIGVVIAAALVPMSTAVQAQTPEQTTIRVMISPSGSGPYNAWSIIQTHMQEFSPWLRLQVEETPGFNYNVKYMLKTDKAWKNTIFGSGTVLDWAAKTGQKPFYSEPSPVAGDFRIIFSMGLTFNVWVTTDEAIRTPMDFVGKKVGIGMLTQNEWGMHQRMLLDAWSLTPKLSSLDTLGTSPNINALLDGRTHVGTLFGLTSAGRDHTVITGPHRQLEASNRNWRYVNVPEGMIEDYVNRTGAPFRVVKYPPNTLPNQPDELVTFGDLLLMEGHKSLPDEVAYEIVTVLIKNYDKIAKLSGFAKVWTSETLVSGAKENPELFHPGALRAFRDLGLL